MAAEAVPTVSGVDLVLDLVGSDTQWCSWPALKRGGVLVSTVSPPDARRAQEAGAVGKHFATRADGAQLYTLASLYASGKLRAEINATCPLADAGAAMAKSMARHVRGKVVIQTA